MNDTINIINNRMSLRKYSKNSITDEELNIILNSAMRAPTAGNMMLYSILVIKDKETMKKLSKTCDNQPFIENSDVILIFLGDLSRWQDYYNLCDVKEFCKDIGRKFRKPDEGDLFLSMQDAIIAAQTAVISAESIGIGSCYIGDIIEHYEIHKEMFKDKEEKLSSKNVYGAKNFGQFNYARKTGSDFSFEMGRSAREILKNFKGK